ncbi:hypothetical protein [Embleya sp. NBC_00896]|uniref:hypothetical protein n=1 Tax=Embleya sp. NBC_00896 TaxID=2975961 RepID=UPI002F90DA6F|nr:hypothetical protein OG928_33785 [Embleya sp. NBC_00896]
MSVPLPTRTLLVCSTVLALGLSLTGCGNTEARGGSGAEPMPTTSLSHPPVGPPADKTRPTDPRPTKWLGPEDPPPLALGSEFVLPNLARVTVTQVATPDDAPAPAGSRRGDVHLRLRHDGAKPLTLDGQVHVSVVRHDDNATHMPQIDPLLPDRTPAPLFGGELTSKESKDAVIGFALEESGFAAGFEVWVTVDQPGRAAPYPVKFLYTPKAG